MKVETYEAISIDEQDGEVVNEQVSEEALALVESMDLEGQRSLVVEREDQTVVRNPYRVMTAEEAAVFGCLLPRIVPLKEYGDGPIPLRVLQVAAHAVELFDQVNVWCPEDASDPDPLLVGVEQTPGQYGGTAMRQFILARWGDVLVPFEDLREKARESMLTNAKRDLAKGEATLARWKATVESEIDSHLLGSSPRPSDYIYLNVT